MSNTVDLDLRVDDQGTISAATGRLTRLETSIDGIDRSMVSFNRQAVKGFKQNAFHANALVSTYARVAANMFAATSLLRVAQTAANFGILTESVQEFSVRSGASIVGLVNSMKEITQGAVDFKTIMKSATLGVSAGLDVSTMKGLTKAANDASRAMGVDLVDAMNRVFRGAVKAEPELLDELGIILRLTTASNKYAASLGKSANQLTTFEKQQAVANEVIAQAEQKYGGLSDAVSKNELSRLTTGVFDKGLQAMTESINALNPVFKAIADNLELLTPLMLLMFNSAIKGANNASISALAYADSLRQVAQATRVQRAEAIKGANLIGTTNLGSVQGQGSILGNVKEQILAGKSVGAKVATAVAQGMHTPAARKAIADSLADSIKKAGRVAAGTAIPVFGGSGIKLTIAQIDTLTSKLAALNRMTIIESQALQQMQGSDAATLRVERLQRALVLAHADSLALKVALRSAMATTATQGIVAGINSIGTAATAATTRLRLLQQASAAVGVAVGAAGVGIRALGTVLASSLPMLAGFVFSVQLLIMGVEAIADSLGYSSKKTREFKKSLDEIDGTIRTMAESSTALAHTLATVPEGLEKSAQVATIQLNMLGSKIDMIGGIRTDLTKAFFVDTADLEKVKSKIFQIVNTISDPALKSKLQGIVAAGSTGTRYAMLDTLREVDAQLKVAKNTAGVNKEIQLEALSYANDYSEILRKSTESILPKATASMHAQVAIQVRLNNLKNESLGIQERLVNAGASTAKTLAVETKMRADAKVSLERLLASSSVANGGSLATTVSEKDRLKAVKALDTEISKMFRNGKVDMQEFIAAFNTAIEGIKLTAASGNIFDGNALRSYFGEYKVALEDEAKLLSNITAKQVNQLEISKERLASANKLIRAEASYGKILGTGMSTALAAAKKLYQARKEGLSIDNATLNKIVKDNSGPRANKDQQTTSINAANSIDLNNIKDIGIQYKYITNLVSEYSATIARISAQKTTVAAETSKIAQIEKEVATTIQGLVSRGILSSKEALDYKTKLLEKNRATLQNETTYNNLLDAGSKTLGKILKSSVDIRKHKKLILDLEDKSLLANQALARAQSGLSKDDKLLKLQLAVNDAKATSILLKKEAIAATGTTGEVQAAENLNTALLMVDRTEKALNSYREVASVSALLSISQRVVGLDAIIKAQELSIGKTKAEVQAQILLQKYLTTESGSRSTLADQQKLYNAALSETNKLTKSQATSAVLTTTAETKQAIEMQKEQISLLNLHLLSSKKVLAIEAQITKAKIAGASTSSLDALRADLLKEVDTSNILDAMKSINDSINSVGTQADSIFVGELSNFLKTGEFNFQSFALSMTNMMADMVSQMLVDAARLNILEALGSKSGGSSSLFGSLANGLIGSIGDLLGGTSSEGLSTAITGGIDNGVAGFNIGSTDFATNSLSGLKFHAKGGISTKPAIFGEAGPEAAVPLPDGRSIPVTLKTDKTATSNTISISINVDSSGGTQTNATGGDKETRDVMQKQLATNISLAVKAEIAKQQRAGGALYSRGR